MVPAFMDGASWRYYAFVVILVLLTSAFTIAQESVDRERHRDYVEGEELRWLTDLGLVVEHRDEYWGYKGTYRGYFIRVYFTWQTSLYHQGRALSVMLYFAEPRRRDGHIDMIRIRRLENELVPRLYESRMVMRTSGYNTLRCELRYSWSIQPAVLHKGIDTVIDTAEEHLLVPINESLVNAMVSKDPQRNGPSIETFQKAYAAR
jgi:hypothetical protein